MKRGGYTLTELLVAMAIVVVLSALVLPVFAAAKEEARATVCVSNFKQTSFASNLYQVDYEDKYFVSKYAGTEENPEKDRTWVQLVYPYMRGLDVVRCPSDTGIRPGLDPVFDGDIMVGNSVERYYTVSTRANTGFNSIYLSPIVRERNGTWTARPRLTSEIGDLSRTLVFGDSVWQVSADGRPSGGGSYLIVPPCRYVAFDRSDSFNLSGYENNRVYAVSRGWGDPQPPRRLQHGGLFPWHGGRLTTIMADGSAKTRTLTQIAEGCDVRPNWGGQIMETGKYLWDLR